ncbi:LamG-like jellyroll fold domain-containing protein [Anaerobaca lacustris]|uniref:Discoidin domain-containing protein n=1 Tax=Anaerobaca lacustris TaxID=3044600 RepID=A0AAW6TYP0_9BACT|nr:discoidin domain-containing protein [Sedimentisphaerales bacterium M17dextr]
MKRSRVNCQRLVMVCFCALAMSCTIQAAIPEGLVAYYKLDSTSGLTATDETGAHDGTLTGALAWVPGKDGNALQFIGGNGAPFVNLGAWQTNGPTGLGLAVWVKWAGSNGLYQGLISQRQGTMYWWTELSTDAAQLRFKSNTSPQGNLFLTSPHLVEDEWTHYACSHDAAAGTGTVYLNGEERLTGSWSLPSGDFSNLNVGLGVVNTADGLGTFNGVLDEAMIFNRPLSVEDVAAAMNGFSDPTASAPKPANGAADVRRDVVLSWRPGETAVAHDVYFGTAFDDVGAADRANPMGVLVSQGQDANTYDPSPLDFGRTYYWRVDEVNAPPSGEIFPGEVWSFTTEPYAYAIEGVTATTNAITQAGAGIENSINGSGLNAADEHSTDGPDMWLGVPADGEPIVIQYEFDRLYKLHEMWVWNYNVMFEPILGFGLKDVTIDYSADGVDWTTLGDFELSQAPGTTTYEPGSTIDLAQAAARYVRLTVRSGWGGMGQYGLSEVRFLHVPAVARDPEPAAGQAGLNPEVVLGWRGGRAAVSHNLYFSDQEEAVADGTALIGSVAEARYDLGALNLGTTYYWKIDEVNEADAPAVWEGDLWSFSTKEYIVVEDFARYTDDIDAGQAIFQTWIDGWENGTGSTVGYLDAPFAEQTIIHASAQSMPLTYDNTVTPWYSEAERTFDPPQDWTVYGADTLVLHVRGSAPGVLEGADGSVLIGAIGSDIWGAADQFRYVYKRLSGNGSIVARVDSVSPSDGWAKAGVMIRETLDAGSTHAMVVVTPSNGVSFQRRVETGAASANTDAGGLAAPYWVKLTRTGNTFAAQRSEDGSTWVDIAPAAPVQISMATDVYIGLAVTSHNANVATLAAFSQIATTGNVTGAWSEQGIGAAQPTGNTPDTLYVVLEDSAGRTAMVAHDDANATVTPVWQEWRIGLDAFGSAGVRVDRIETMTIGVGNRDNPAAGGKGLIYIDDIAFGRPLDRE